MHFFTILCNHYYILKCLVSDAVTNIRLQSIGAELIFKGISELGHNNNRMT